MGGWNWMEQKLSASALAAASRICPYDSPVISLAVTRLAGSHRAILPKFWLFRRRLIRGLWNGLTFFQTVPSLWYCRVMECKSSPFHKRHSLLSNYSIGQYLTFSCMNDSMPGLNSYHLFCHRTPWRIMHTSTVIQLINPNAFVREYWIPASVWQ